MSDVVSRLLAAIDEREREYNRCAEELREAARAKARLPHTEFLRATVGDGLRLCQALRDIVARHSPVTIQVYDPVKYGHTNPSDFADEQACVRCGTPSEYPVAWPCADLIDLARGYGVEDGED